MTIRKATLNDFEELRTLYFGTITSINTIDYDEEQIAAWASTASRTESLIKKIREQDFYVAHTEDGKITGFASLASSGYLDMMYVHKDFQGQGIAKSLLKTILEKAKSLEISTVETEASKTAKPFFEKNGFETVLEQLVYINNVALTNYKMRRILL